MRRRRRRNARLQKLFDFDIDDTDVETYNLKRRANDDDAEFTPGDDDSIAAGLQVPVEDKIFFGKKRKTNSLATVSTKSYHVNAQDGKPEPYGKPLLWASIRQQLCETTDYYRAYQSSAYTHNKRVYGFMCDKEVTDRDVFTDQILISRM